VWSEICSYIEENFCRKPFPRNSLKKWEVTKVSEWQPEGR